MKTIVKSFAALATALAFSNCTTYVDPGVSVSPAPTTTATTTTATTASPYYSGDSVTTRKTTTTY